MDAGLAQQALEALMRGRFPAVERVARVRIDARGLDTHEQLPGLVGWAKLLHRPRRAERRRMLWQAHMNVVRQRRTAGTAGDMLRLPAEHVAHEAPRIAQRRLAFVLADVPGDLRAIDLGLPHRHELEVL